LLKLCIIQVKFSAGGITFRTEKGSDKSSGTEEQLLALQCLYCACWKEVH